MSEEKKGGNNTEKEQVAKSTPDWFEFILSQQVSDKEIKERLEEEINGIMQKYENNLKERCTLFLFDNNYSIDSFVSDRIYASLLRLNEKKEKDVLLLVSSKGGSIEPAYQTSKICKKFSKKYFIAVVPRAAKSAATLICLGADKIHMGLLSELGPIDPQHLGRPVLGLRYSLEQIAEISEKHPGSSQMFSEYLAKSLYVPNIGYYERLGASAVQYAERLLSNKKNIETDRAHKIAEMLVYEYKDHSFVIDFDEAKNMLGDLIETDTSDLKFSEQIYQLLDLIDFTLGFRKKTLRVIGSADSIYIVKLPKGNPLSNIL